MPAGVSVEWTQTARGADHSLTLLKDMPPLTMAPAQPASTDGEILLRRATVHDPPLAGFGGAFTETAALNWLSLEPEDRDEVIRLYFASAEDGGLGYTVGRVPINSCDFSLASYTFDDVAYDVELEHFDDSVQHDVDNGIIPMINAAQAAVRARGMQLKIVASPWSPPAWMKEPVCVAEGRCEQSMTLSAAPNGLKASMQRPWANYFSRWLSAYRERGVDVWAVTVQNDPEAAAGWEAMLWTPEFMATFVRDHLGPVLAAEHPSVAIFGFDQNKDHVVKWVEVLYADPAARDYFVGVGVHWYGGLHTDRMEAAHALAPEKLLLATEACSCVGGVVYDSPNLAAWWTRAEKLALDILEDLRFWAVAWIDWNLLVDTSGGPNHLRNLCDANIIADPQRKLGRNSTLIKQASFYYMAHFSRYLLPGSRRIDITNYVEMKPPPLSPSDIKNGAALVFVPCEGGNTVQQFRLAPRGASTPRALIAVGTDTAAGSDGYGIGGECVEHCISGDCWFPKVQLWACKQPSNPDPLHGANQEWRVNMVPGGDQLVNPATSKCLTAVTAAGWAVGLDTGLTVSAAQLFPCYPPGTHNQTFLLVGDGHGDKITDGTITVTSALNGKCLQPQIEQLPHFDAVAFERPDGQVALVVMNTNDDAVDVTVRDEVASLALTHTVPGHAIHTYRWTPSTATTSAVELASSRGRTADGGSATISAAAFSSDPSLPFAFPSADAISSPTPTTATTSVLGSSAWLAMSCAVALVVMLLVAGVLRVVVRQLDRSAGAGTTLLLVEEDAGDEASAYEPFERRESSS